jgi:molybdenum cofactor biosynthesis enzyme MoaA
MKIRQKLLTDEQWELIEPLFPKVRRRRTGVADHQPPIEPVSQEFCGSCKRVRRGGSCQRNFLPLRPVGGGCDNGKRKAFG